MSIKQKPVKNQTGAIMIRVGHEKCNLIHKAARHAGMSRSRLCGILSLDGAAKILAGKMSINTETKLIEKNVERIHGDAGAGKQRETLPPLDGASC